MEHHPRERGLLRICVAYAAFPVCVVGALFSCHFALTSGLSGWVSASVGTVAGLLLVALAERLAPYRVAWSRSHGDLRTDLSHAIVNAAVPELFRLGSFGLLIGLGASLRQQIGTAAWPVHWPLLAQLCVALLVAEFFAYWLHRGLHELGPLWPWHAPHHSARRLYFLNAARFHPGEILVTQALHVGPLLVLGCPAEVLALHGAFTATHGFLQHGNVPFRLGPLNWVFSMAQLHRWHHSRVLEEANHNYGANLIVWDVLFGTRYLPPDREAPEQIGISALPNFPESYLEHVRAPFGWRRLQRLAADVEADAVAREQQRTGS